MLNLLLLFTWDRAECHFYPRCFSLVINGPPLIVFLTGIYLISILYFSDKLFCIRFIHVGPSYSLHRDFPITFGCDFRDLP